MGLPIGDGVRLGRRIEPCLIILAACGSVVTATNDSTTSATLAGETSFDSSSASTSPSSSSTEVTTTTSSTEPGSTAGPTSSDDESTTTTWTTTSTSTTTSATSDETTTSTTTADDSTSTTEAPDPVCGNRYLEADELCDDGNLDEYDGCTSTCTLSERSVDVGDGVSCATNLGVLRCWGFAGLGTLGHGDGDYADIGDDEPASAGGDVDVGGDVVKIETSGYNTCALLVGGDVRAGGKAASMRTRTGFTVTTSPPPRRRSSTSAAGP